MELKMTEVKNVKELIENWPYKDSFLNNSYDRYQCILQLESVMAQLIEGTAPKDLVKYMFPVINYMLSQSINEEHYREAYKGELAEALATGAAIPDNENPLKMFANANANG
jgi:hypothetical protein